MSFHWQAIRRDGERATAQESVAAGLPGQFDSQEDAEAWLGECFEELRSAGLGAVSLYEGGNRLIYGPMGLDPS